MDTHSDDPISVLQRMFHVRQVNEEIQLYANTGDARFLWRAFLLMRKAGDTIPEDFMAKFEQWGRKVVAADGLREIAAALELSGGNKRHIGPKHGASYRTRWKLAGEVAHVQRLYSITLKAAKEAVARNSGLSYATVHREYHKVVPSKRRSGSASGVMAVDSALRSWKRTKG
jgi:hypothetical protein